MNEKTVFSASQVKPPIITLRALQRRFPLLANGASTKFDLLKMFLTVDRYADSVLPDIDQQTQLRLLIMTGLNRLDASEFVDFRVGDAALFMALLVALPEGLPFRLTTAEAAAILDQTTIQDGERPHGGAL